MTENRQKAYSTTPACRQHSQSQVGDNERTTSSVLERTAVGLQEAASSRTQEGREPVWLSGYQGGRLLREGVAGHGLTSCKHTGVSSLGKPEISFCFPSFSRNPVPTTLRYLQLQACPVSTVTLLQTQITCYKDNCYKCKFPALALLIKLIRSVRWRL